jgi:hypothetical protein
MSSRAPRRWKLLRSRDRAIASVIIRLLHSTAGLSRTQCASGWQLAMRSAAAMKFARSLWSLEVKAMGAHDRPGSKVMYLTAPYSYPQKRSLGTCSTSLSLAPESELAPSSHQKRRMLTRFEPVVHPDIIGTAR